MSKKDKAWSRSLVRNLKYNGPVVHFVRTSLPLNVNDSTVPGAVYQALKKPQFFYVVNGDAMLKLGNEWLYNRVSAGSQIQEFYRVPQPRWRCAVRVGLISTKRKSDLARARLQSIQISHQPDLLPALVSPNVGLS
jgi:hypothetical protein